jgi:hypothetical protein
MEHCAYRRYSIIKDLFRPVYYVMKDGHNIGSAASIALAKKLIDELLAD